MDYSRSNVRAYFAGFTPDSRPCPKGRCPIQVALGLEFASDATRLDSVLAGAIDRAAAEFPDGLPNWAHLTAKQILEVIDGMPA